ncbi:hypothetical protein SELMODRAFT_112202 [Selaginella moellendorffii]|uniref:Bidirectional sugar transporter SWEET n=1 Tax=Selaginella moellendorffii TaxID=88036 RepID=D8SAE7_SELML|nr:hypothetical protein SELMODRAFT_112202 [Selaginella moellendorffii]
MAIAATIIGVAGNVVAALMFLSSILTFIRIAKKKSTESFSSVPYIASLLNCILWVLYGSPINKNATLVVTINGLGTVLNVIYVLLFLFYARKSPKALKRASLYTFSCLAIMAAVGFGISLGIHSKDTRITIFGVLCIVLNIAMYWSPLSVMYRIFKTKSVEFLPFYLCLTVFINSALWFAYALLKHDIYILVPNVLGLAGGAVQLFCHYIYYKPGNLLTWQVPDEKEAEESESPDLESGIELPKQNGKFVDVALNTSTMATQS